MLFYLVVIYSNEVDCWKFLRCEFLYLNFYFIVIVEYFQQACFINIFVIVFVSEDNTDAEDILRSCSATAKQRYTLLHSRSRLHFVTCLAQSTMPRFQSHPTHING